jgi:hypothetical protein
MNRINLIAAAALAVAFSAATPVFAAGEATYELPVAATSTLTRADVQAQLFAARAAGHVAHGERSVVIAEVGTPLTRAQVRAETLEAIRIGAIDRHEDSTQPTAAQLESIRLAGQRALAMQMASAR